MSEIKLPVQSNYESTVIVDAVNNVICSFSSSDFSSADDLQHASQIARCLNSHPELMKALELAEGYLDAFGKHYAYCTVFSPDATLSTAKCNCGFSEALSVIARAKSL